MAQPITSDLAVRLTDERIVCADVNFQRRYRLALAHAQVELFDLPRTQAFSKVFGEAVRVGGSLERFDAHQSGSLVMAVPVAWCAVETGDDDVGAVHPDRVHDVAENHLSAPMFECLIQPFGKAEIGHTRKQLVNAVVTVRSQQLLSA